MLTGDKKNMTREIRDLFDSTINRAKTIARTETARAYAVGNYTGAIEAKKRGYNVKKYWLAVIDDRTCPICRRLHNKYDKDNAINVEKEFIDEKWRGISPVVHPNCRCDVIYFIE
jgi:SPP1 gp7 family putative phage head morphogenesis protein